MNNNSGMHDTATDLPALGQTVWGFWDYGGETIMHKVTLVSFQAYEGARWQLPSGKRCQVPPHRWKEVAE